MKERKIIILTAGEGHLSLAEAAKDYLTGILKAKTKIIDLMGDSELFKTYRIFYRFLPGLHKIPYKISKRKRVQKLVKDFFIKEKRKEILDVIKKEKPDLIINTYFGYIPILDEFKPISTFKYINIIHDPVNIHPLLFSHEADYNFGFGNEVKKIGKELKIKNNRIISSGWLTRKKFFKDHDLNKIKKSLGL